MLVLYCTFRVR